ncbi:MAG TPA: FoF1 ATP synthase subunit gamma [Anaeromyxobacteraceae bacterium]|nr:FoF1 ATP synthase subunit gamma [Anaeromyxobacteraceae bacterium]
MRQRQELERRLRSLEALGATVGAMKSLSAHHFREIRASVEPARLYRQGIDRMIEWSRPAPVEGAGPQGLIVLGSELGLCGAYNARVAGAAARRRAELGEGPTLCVGRRAGLLLVHRGVRANRVYPGLARSSGIGSLLLRLAEDTLQLHATAGVLAFEVVSSRFEGVGSDTPTVTRLLPARAGAVERGPSGRYVSGDHLAAAVVREFLYITLYDLLLDALASEHGARIVATQSAERWLRDRTSQLRRHLASARREAGTQEVIEIAAGARARLPR